MGCDYCPDSDLFAPCTCYQDVITCINTADDLDLDEKFTQLANGAPKGLYNTFILEDNYITSLPASLFHGIRFKHIILNGCSKLSCVNPNAFNGLGDDIQTFTSDISDFSAPKNQTCDLFGALSTLKNVVSIKITGSNVPEIPDNAFSQPLGPLKYLEQIDFGGSRTPGKLTKIGHNAFSTLNNLQLVDLSRQAIASIGAEAFAMSTRSNDVLEINLEMNRLSGPGFGQRVFPLNRPVTVHLNGNMNLTQLPETAFYDMLAAGGHDRNRVYITGPQMEIDRNNLWLVQNKVQLDLKNKLFGALGADGRPLLDHTVKQMDKDPANFTINDNFYDMD
ncbi:unnamed protein product [Medioppia subpectinata]|uniref:Oplophorus-luciferin 2-monooxygenase non-catalytic subunit n=1 Tax=Medioppia subpectinata TaxID=1979941 RepID=A0A7R9KGZ2_9ACAR|nr:unnamed protein product [Medioppia subpectinata]CAG2103163.1 unnamed protein product [Medioppia subpectinata]